MNTPIAQDIVQCPDCDIDVIVYQYESTDTPKGTCAKCGQAVWAYYDTKTWKVTAKKGIRHE